MFIIKKHLLLCLLLNHCLGAMEDDTKELIKKNDIAYMQEHMGQWALDRKITGVEELKGGLGGSRLYTVNFDSGEPYVVRLLVGSFAREKDWQMIEIDAMKAAYDSGVGPCIVAAHEKSEDTPIGYIIMHKIKVAPHEAVRWDDSKTYNCLGNFLRKMHAAPSVVNTDTDSIFRRTNGIVARIKDVWEKNHTEGVSKELAQVKELFEGVRHIWNAKERTNLVHGDLLWGNLLHDGTDFVAVDWEQSRLASEPLFDVALVHDCMVPKKHRATFMQGYCDKSKLSSADREQFILARFMADCFVGLAYACSQPMLFAQLVQQHTENKTDVNQALHDITRDGLKRNTSADCATFGSLLFMQGYRQLSPKRLAVMKKMIAELQQ